MLVYKVRICEGSDFTIYRNMEIGKTLLKSLIRHVETLIEKGEFNYCDVKTANALRLSRKEIRKINEMIKRFEHGKPNRKMD